MQSLEGSLLDASWNRSRSVGLNVFSSRRNSSSQPTRQLRYQSV